MKNKTTYLLIAIFSQMACTQFIDLSDKTIEPIIVLNSILTPDSSIKVELYRNTSIYEVDKKIIRDAEVTLYENGLVLDKLNLKYSVIEDPYFDDIEGGEQFDTTFYYTSAKAIARQGCTYKITASAPGFEMVTAQTAIPQQAVITGIDTASIYSLAPGYENLTLNLLLNFDDAPEIDNYYRVIMCLKRGRLKTDSINGEAVEYINVSDWGSTPFKSKSPALTSQNEDANSSLIGAPKNKYKVFNDELFNGKRYQLDLTKEFGIMSSNIEREPEYQIKDGEFFHFTIYLHSITADTYFYLKSFEMQQFYNDIPFIEPVIVYSNIENGAGVFGSYSLSKYEVTFGQYPVEGVLYNIDRK